MREKWNSCSIVELREDSMDESGRIGRESVWEDVIKLHMAISSFGECQLTKYYHTDGFAFYFDESTKNITFLLHECKVGDKVVGKTLKGHNTCFKKALLQNIGYYFKIKHGLYNNFNNKLNNIVKMLGYTSVADCISDNFGMFLITTPEFIGSVTMTDHIKSIINSLEEYIINTTKSPSKYWEDENLKRIISNLDMDEVVFDESPNVDLAKIGDMLNKLLKREN